MFPNAEAPALPPTPTPTHFKLGYSCSFTSDSLTADVQQWFGVETHCGHVGDHVLCVGEAELVFHRQSFFLEKANETL